MPDSDCRCDLAFGSWEHVSEAVATQDMTSSEPNILGNGASEGDICFRGLTA